MYDEDWKTTTTSPETMLQTCRAEGVLFLVIVKSKHSQVVRVKSVLQRTETEGGYDALSSRHRLIPHLSRYLGTSFVARRGSRRASKDSWHSAVQWPRLASPSQDHGSRE